MVNLRSRNIPASQPTRKVETTTKTPRRRVLRTLQSSTEPAGTTATSQITVTRAATQIPEPPQTTTNCTTTQAPAAVKMMNVKRAATQMPSCDGPVAKKVRLEEPEDTFEEIREQPLDSQNQASNYSDFTSICTMKEGGEVIAKGLYALRNGAKLYDDVIMFNYRYALGQLNEHWRNNIHIFDTTFFKEFLMICSGITYEGLKEQVKYICHQPGKRFLKKIKLLMKETIIIPINISDHWVSVVVNNPMSLTRYHTTYTKVACPTDTSDICQIFYLDSLPRHLGNETRKKIRMIVLIILEQLVQNENLYFWKDRVAQVEIDDLPNQGDNKVDCGVFMLHFGETIINNGTPIVRKEGNRYVASWKDYRNPCDPEEFRKTVSSRIYMNMDNEKTQAYQSYERQRQRYGSRKTDGK